MTFLSTPRIGNFFVCFQRTRLRCLIAALLFLGGCQAGSSSHSGGEVRFEPLVPSEISAPGAAIPPAARQAYRGMRDHGQRVQAIPDLYLTSRTIRQQVNYGAPYPAGSIVVDPAARHLYHLMGNGRAMRYFVGVGAAGQGFSGEAVLARQQAWPSWTPTPEMIAKDPGTYGPWKGGMAGGETNPLGARALYLYRNGQDTLYRIHGTPHPSSVGRASSNGCIRMFNQDVIHLAARVQNSARVVVLSDDQSGSWTQPSN